MRNFKKISAVVVALAIMVTTFVPAFAETNTTVNEDKAIVLNTLDLYAGTSTSSFVPSLETELTRGQGAVLISKLFNMDDAALALTDAQANEILKGFADAGKVPSYAKNRLAYLVQNNIMSGSLDTSTGKVYIDADKSLLGGQFATLLLKQMGFTVASWKLAVVQLSNADGAKDIASYLSFATNELLRDQAVGIMYGSLTAEYADGLATIIEKIVAAKPELKAAAVAAGLIVVVDAALAVESVKTLNAKQIEITFNQAMNEESAETESFYVIKDNGSSTAKTLGTDSASLNADGKTVTITLDATVADKLTNSTTANITVNKDIKAANGNKLAANKSFDVVVQDGIIPSVVKAEATGEYTVKITFSEPVYGGTTDINASDFKVVSGTYTYFVQTAALSGNVINLTLGTKLIEGPVVVTVNKDGVDTTKAIRDYAGYKVFKGDTTLNYVKDTSVAVVTVAEAKPTSVKLAFSKPVKGTNVRLYHSANGASAYLSEVDTNGYVDSITFPYATTNPVPAGNVKFYLVNSTTSGEALVDGYSVKVPDQTITSNVVVDVTAPAVASTELKTNVSYQVTFDEEVNETTAELASSYTFKSVSDNKDVYFTATLDATKKIVTLSVPGYLDDNTQYQVVVKAAKDLAGNAIASDMAFAFTTADNTAPEIAAADSYVVNADGKIYLTFSEPMNEAQMLDKANYMVQPTNGAAYRALDDEDTITKISNKVVLIDLDEAVLLPDVKVAPIMDLAAKRLFSSVDSVILIDLGVETVKVDSAKLVAKNKVKVVFNRQLSAFSNTDIVFTGVTAGAIMTQSVESMVTNGDGNTEVVLILDKDLTTDVKYNTSAITAETIATPASVSVSGTKLGGSQLAIVIADGTAPAMVTYDDDINASTDEVASVIVSGNVITQAVNTKVAEGTTGTITIKFTEAIDTLTLSTLTFKVDGYTVAGITNATANEVVLAIKANADNTAIRTSVTQVYNIADVAGNVFASGTTWTVR